MSQMRLTYKLKKGMSSRRSREKRDGCGTRFRGKRSRLHPWTFKWWPVAEIGRAEALATQKAGCENGPEEDPRRAEV